MRQILFSVIVSTAFVVTACGAVPTPDAMMEKPGEAMAHTTSTADAMMGKETPTADAMMPKETPTSDPAMSGTTPTTEAMMDAPVWFSIPLTDIRTGTAFTIQDFKGKVVLVETMAVWCSKCLTQQKAVRVLHRSLGYREDFVSIGLDIDPYEDAPQLQRFVDAQGFDWLYAISPADVSRELAALYGDQFLNPPSTPMLVIDRHGVVHPLPFGIKTSDELLQIIQPFLDESM